MRFLSRYCLILCFILSACSDDPEDNTPQNDTDIIADAGPDANQPDANQPDANQPDANQPQDTNTEQDIAQNDDTAPDTETDTTETDATETDTPTIPDTCPTDTLDVNGDATRCLPQTQIATGSQNSCAITADGHLYCWGHNFAEPASPHLTAQQIGTQDGWQSISVGQNHICGIRSGQLFCWGQNTLGQLGNGTQSPNPTTEPTQIGNDTSWAIVSAGHQFTCAIQAGQLFCWGQNTHGQIGNDTTDTQTTPTPIGTQFSTDDSWTHLSAGQNHACAIQAGKLFCWGDRNFGKLGTGDDINKLVPTPVPTPTTTPENTPDATRNTWTDIAAGNEHTCGIFQSSLYCWGSNNAWQLGIESTLSEKSPRLVDDLPLWQSVTTGRAHSCALDTMGRTYCWGQNSDGQIGDGTTTNTPTPKSIIIFEAWQAVAAAADHTCGIRENLFVCWGQNTSGVLGNATTDNKQTAPTPVSNHTDWDQISTNNSHTCALRQGELYCWGNNASGRLGTGQPNNVPAPTPTQITTENDWTHISTGDQHTCGIRSGQLFCWGAHQNGALGIEGLTSAQRTPIRIGTDVDWQSVTANYFNTCAIRSGELYCWGFNPEGQLGIGNTSQANTPTRVTTSENNETGWQSVSMNRWHTCGIKTGKLFCWGSGSNSGGLGNGATTSSTSPIQIGTETDWTNVTTGVSRTCATRNNETYCWGNAPIGDDTNTAQRSPTKISADKNATTVAAATAHTCAIWNGELFCWGQNTHYQLGTTTVTQTNTPLQITNHNVWTHLTAHTNHTCAIRSGQIFCWGDNANGQLGIPTPLTPQPVVGF